MKGGKLVHGSAGGTGGFTRKLGELPKMFRPGSRAGASVVPCGMLVAVSSQYSDVWMESMRMEFGGLVAAGTFAEENETSEGCNIIDVRWLYKWKGGSHDMVDRAKARMVVI